MKRKKSIFKIKRPSSPSSTKKKKHDIHKAFAAIKPRKARPTLEPWMEDDFIPMRHFRNGRPRPLGSQCTCMSHPNKYCWVHKCWAARPEICPDPDAEEPPDLWDDPQDVDNGSDNNPSNYFGDEI